VAIIWKDQVRDHHELLPVINWLTGGCALPSALPGWRQSAPHNWLLSDLRLLRLPKQGDPTRSMVALYPRNLGSDLLIRIDL
jgi:hypothetical protein